MSKYYKLVWSGRLIEKELKAFDARMRHELGIKSSDAGTYSGAAIGDFNGDGYQFSDSPSTSDAHDTIGDFVSGTDRIDLSAIDASANSPSEDAFTYIGRSKFSGQAGELRWFHTDRGAEERRVVAADTDGDGVADIRIDVIGKGAMSETDFLL